MTLSSYEAHWRRWPDFRRRVSDARLSLETQIELDAERVFEPDWEAAEALPEPGIEETIRVVMRRNRGR
jgi:hypothetical protein